MSPAGRSASKPAGTRCGGRNARLTSTKTSSSSGVKGPTVARPFKSTKRRPAQTRARYRPSNPETRDRSAQSSRSTSRHRHQPRQPARAADYQRPDEKTQRCRGQYYRGRRYDDSSQRALPAPEKREPAGHCHHTPSRHLLALPQPKPPQAHSNWQPAPGVPGLGPEKTKLPPAGGVWYRRSACAGARRMTALSDAQARLRPAASAEVTSAPGQKDVRAGPSRVRETGRVNRANT